MSNSTKAGWGGRVFVPLSVFYAFVGCSTGRMNELYTPSTLTRLLTHFVVPGLEKHELAQKEQGKALEGFEAYKNSAESVNVHVPSNGETSDNIPSFTSNDDNVTQNKRVDHGTQSFVMHQRVIPQSLMQNYVHPSLDSHGLVSSEYQCANGQYLGQGYLDSQNSQGPPCGSTAASSSVNEQALQSGNGDYLGSDMSENSFQDISSQLCDVLRLESYALNQKPEETNGQVTPGDQNVLDPLKRNLESA